MELISLAIFVKPDEEELVAEEKKRAEQAHGEVQVKFVSRFLRAISRISECRLVVDRDVDRDDVPDLRDALLGEQVGRLGRDSIRRYCRPAAGV